MKFSIALATCIFSISALSAQEGFAPPMHIGHGRSAVLSADYGVAREACEQGISIEAKKAIRRAKSLAKSECVNAGLKPVIVEVSRLFTEQTDYSGVPTFNCVAVSVASCQ